MIEIANLELFDALGKNIKSLNIYQEILDSIERERIHQNLFINSIQNGIWITLDRKLRIKYILLFAESENYGRYKKELPAGISFDFSREKVRELLGNPDNLYDYAYYEGDIYEINHVNLSNREHKFMEIVYHDDYSTIQLIKLKIIRKNFFTDLEKAFASTFLII